MRDVQLGQEDRSVPVVVLVLQAMMLVLTFAVLWTW